MFVRDISHLLVVSFSGFDIRVLWPYEFGSDLSSVFWVFFGRI